MTDVLIKLNLPKYEFEWDLDYLKSLAGYIQVVLKEQTICEEATRVDFVHLTWLDVLRQFYVALVEKIQKAKKTYKLKLKQYVYMALMEILLELPPSLDNFDRAALGAIFGDLVHYGVNNNLIQVKDGNILQPVLLTHKITYLNG